MTELKSLIRVQSANKINKSMITHLGKYRTQLYMVLLYVVNIFMIVINLGASSLLVVYYLLVVSQGLSSGVWLSFGV